MRQHVRWKGAARGRSWAARFSRIPIALMVLALCAACDSDSPTEPNIMAAFTIGGDGLKVIFSDDSSGNPGQWFWTFGDGGTGSQRIIDHEYAKAGRYGVFLRACKEDGSGCSETTKFVEVFEAGAPVFN